MKKKILALALTMAIIIVVISSIAFYFNNKDKSSDMKESQIRVVTSFYPTYILMINLTDGIDELKVDSLTDFSAGCLHDYQLTTNDMKLLTNADVLVINGGGMEEYLDDVKDNYTKLTVIDLSHNIPMLESETHEGEENPHVWLDPELYMLQIENAKEGLTDYISHSDIGDSESDVITALSSNAAEYLDKVSELADDMNQILDTVKDMVINKSISNKVVVFHDSFAYLANKAGLEVAYMVEVEEDTPLSAGEVAEIIRAIKDENIRYLFTEEQYDDTISDRIKDETNAKLYIIDSAVTGDTDKDSYLRAMRRNIEVLRKAFEE